MDNKLFYSTCVYAGIDREIDYQMKHGTEDMTEQLQYAVDRYCEEHIVSGSYLQEKLEKYKQVVADRQKGSEGIEEEIGGWNRNKKAR